jgi:hypothetical protein
MSKNVANSADALNKLLPEQIKVIDEYIRNNRLLGLSHVTCHCRRRELEYFGKHISKPFEKMTEEDTKKYIDKMSKNRKPST